MLIVGVLMLLGTHGMHAAASSEAERFVLSEDAKYYAWHATKSWGKPQALRVEGPFSASGRMDYNGVLAIAIMDNREELDKLQERVVELEHIVKGQQHVLEKTVQLERPELETTAEVESVSSPQVVWSGSELESVRRERLKTAIKAERLRRARRPY